LAVTDVETLTTNWHLLSPEIQAAIMAIFYASHKTATDTGAPRPERGDFDPMSHASVDYDVCPAFRVAVSLYLAHVLTGLLLWMDWNHSTSLNPSQFPGIFLAGWFVTRWAGVYWRSEGGAGGRVRRVVRAG
jgi:hypothetical protein